MVKVGCPPVLDAQNKAASIYFVQSGVLSEMWWNGGSGIDCTTIVKIGLLSLKSPLLIKYKVYWISMAMIIHH